MKRYYYYAIVIVFIIPLCLYWFLSHMPVGLAFMFSDFKKTEVQYIPFEHKEPYATTTIPKLGDYSIRIYYVGSQQKLVFKVSHMQRDDDPKWMKDTLLHGSNYHYEEQDNKQIFEWQDEKDNQQYTLTYTGDNPLPKEELVKIAESVVVK